MPDSTRELALLLNHHISREFISKAELSRRTGISRSNLDLYLKGRSSPTLETLDKLAAALDMPPWKAIRPASESVDSAISIQEHLNAIETFQKALARANELNEHLRKENLNKELIELRRQLSNTSKSEPVIPKEILDQLSDPDTQKLVSLFSALNHTQRNAAINFIKSLTLDTDSPIPTASSQDKQKKRK